jgi:putative inorganic carbon (hco3(-)) transporter
MYSNSPDGSANLLKNEGRGSSFEMFVLFGLVIVSIGRFQEAVSFLMPLHLGLVVLLVAAVVAIQKAGAGSFRIREPGLAEPGMILWLLVVALISSLFSMVHMESLNFMRYTFIQLIFMFYFTANVVRTPAQLRTALWAFILSMFLLALPSIADKSGAQRWSSVDSTYDANDLALLCNVAIAFLVCLLPRARGYQKIVLLAFLPVFLYALALTGSRGGLIGLAVVSVLLLYRIRSIGLFKKICIALLLVAVGVAFTPNSSKERYATIGEEDYNSTDDFGRVKIWQRNLGIIASNPVFGVGPGNFGYANGITYASDVGGNSWRVTAHNCYILIGVEMGLCGLGLFLALFFRCLSRMRHLQREALDHPGFEEIASLALAIEAGLLAYMVCGFFLSVCYWVLPYFLVALGVALQRYATVRRLELGVEPPPGQGGLSPPEFQA